MTEALEKRIGKTEKAERVIIPLCLWKQIAHDDALKAKMKINTTTLNPKSPCHACNGIIISCDNYSPVKNSSYGVLSGIGLSGEKDE